MYHKDNNNLQIFLQKNMKIQWIHTYNIILQYWSMRLPYQGNKKSSNIEFNKTCQLASVKQTKYQSLKLVFIQNHAQIML